MSEGCQNIHVQFLLVAVFNLVFSSNKQCNFILNVHKNLQSSEVEVDDVAMMQKDDA